MMGQQSKEKSGDYRRIFSQPSGRTVSCPLATKDVRTPAPGTGGLYSGQIQLGPLSNGRTDD